MAYALICTDKPDRLQTRIDTRSAHLDYIAATGVVSQAGPFLSETGEMTGSLLVLEVETLQQAQDWADKDPYALAGLFASVEIRAWKKVI